MFRAGLFSTRKKKYAAADYGHDSSITNTYAMISDLKNTSVTSGISTLSHAQ